MSSLYDKGRQRFLEGQINWLADNIKVCLIEQGAYSYDLAVDEFLSDVPSGSIVATSANLSGKTSTGGSADADDYTFSAITGPIIGAAVVYKDTGSAATSPLICYIDAGTGLPVTPNTGDIVVRWDDGASKIFRL